MAKAGISGRGIVSSLGRGVAETVRNLYADNPKLPALPRRLATSLPLPVFELELDTPPNTPGGRTVELLNLALDEALDEAGLSRPSLKGQRIGVAVGTTVACQLNDIPFHAVLRTGNVSDPTPIQNFLLGNPAEHIRRKLNLNGPAVTISNACASGADAIGVALTWLRNGSCDIAIAAGADEFSKVPFDGFNALGVCSHSPCRPFDVQRDGLNLGEAAAVVILENSDHAVARRHHQNFYAAGFGKTADSFHITQPEPEGTQLESAIRLCLEQACVRPEFVEFINAHGTGTPTNDGTEGRVLSRVFGPQAKYMSTKSLTGHTLGAAGTVEFILTQLMLENGCALRNHRCTTPDPTIPVPPLSRDCPVPGRLALSTSLAFGGSNTALAVARL